MPLDEIRAELKAYQEQLNCLRERADVLGQQAAEAQKALNEYSVSNRVSALRTLQWALEALGVEL